MGCASSHHKVLNHANFENVMPHQANMGTLNNEDADYSQATKTWAPADFHDQFIIIDKLGKGAFARVYNTVRKVDGKEYAVKVTDLRTQGLEGQNNAVCEICPRMQALCESEASILQEIGQQGNCISIIDYFQEDFLSYMVMEKCEMTLLQGIERSVDVNESLYAKVFRDMLSALASIHALNIVHLDVKPDNFLCEGSPRTGVVKLCDFGLAKKTKNQPRKHNRDIHGTAPFMAPEMLLKMGYDEKSDVWSFAVIAYVLFFGCFPYQPSDRSAKGMKVAIAQGYPAPDFLPRSSVCCVHNPYPHLSLKAEEFCRHLLNRDPMFRPSSKKALQHKFLNTAVTEELPSLRPILNAAKTTGAFTPAISRKERETPDQVDDFLYELQARRGPVGYLDYNKMLDASKFGTGTTAASSTHHQSGTVTTCPAQSSACQEGTLSSVKAGTPSSSHDSVNRATIRGLEVDAAKARQQQSQGQTARGSSRSCDELPVMTQLKKQRDAMRQHEQRASNKQMVPRSMSAVKAGDFGSLPGRLSKQGNMMQSDGLRADSSLERAMELTLHKNLNMRLQTLANQGQQGQQEQIEKFERKTTPPMATMRIKNVLGMSKKSRVGLVAEASNESTESSTFQQAA